MQYQVKDPQGQLHIIDGPEGATPDEVMAQAQKLVPVSNPHEPNPIMDTVQKTLELGGTVAGGMAGATAGTLADPVIGPAGTVGGAIVGAGLGRAAGTSASNVIRNYMNPSQTPSLGDQFKDVAASGVQGAKDQATGEAVGAVAKPVISTLDEMINNGLAKLSTLKLGANVPEKAAEIAKNAKFNIPSASQDEIETGVQKVQDALNDAKSNAGAILNKAKSDIGIPVTVADKEASLLAGNGVHGLGKDEVNSATQAMLDSKTPEDLAANISQFKQMASAGNSDKKLTARVANALQDKVNQFVDWNKTGSAVEGVLKQQYKDLGNIVADNATGLQGAKGQMSEVLGVFDDLKGKLNSDVPGKAETFLRSLFTKDTPVNRGYIDKLAQLEQLSGKPVLTDLFQKFAGESFDKLAGSPKLASAAALEAAHSVLSLNPYTAGVSAAYLGAQSPALIKAAGKANAAATEAALNSAKSKLFKPTVIGLNNVLKTSPILQSLKDKLNNQ